MSGMDVFNISAGVASIISLIIAVLTFNKVTKIESQTIKNVKKSDIKQAGRNIK